jgi:CBS domain-containing protein
MLAQGKEGSMGLLRLAQETPEVSPATTVAEAVAIMTTRRVGAVAVTRGRKILGVFTERDLMRRVVFERRDPDTTIVRDVMTSPARTVPDSMSVEEAATLMRDAHIRHLAVVDRDGDLLGMVGLRYILYDLLGELEQKVDGLHMYLMVDGPGG